MKTTSETNEKFKEELNKFLISQGKNLSLIDTHGHNCQNCSRDIVAVKIIYGCQALLNNAYASNGSAFNLSPEYDIHSPHLTVDENERNNHGTVSFDPTRSDRHEHQSGSSVSSDEYPINVTVSSVISPLQLLMSPASSSSIVNSPTHGNNNTLSLVNTNKFNSGSCLFANDTKMSSPNKSLEHTIDEEQVKTLRYLQRQTDDSLMFSCNIDGIQQRERTLGLVISQDDMNQLKLFKQNHQIKRDAKNNNVKSTNLPSDNTVEHKGRNYEWTVILDEYVERSNDYCVFAYERHHFTIRNSIGNSNQFFLSADAHCVFSTCSCEFHAIVNENGTIAVTYSGHIDHIIGEIHARPYRGSRRENLQKLTSLGATPNALHLAQLKLLSDNNKKSGNRNSVGSSASVIRKISSEANVKLRQANDLHNSLHQIKGHQAKTVFPGEPIPGYLQVIGVEPLRLVCFTAGGIAAYHKFALNMPLSWDATGGIVMKREKQIYYYELTMTNLIKGGPSLPITSMLSESHGTMDIIHWMNCFIEKYKQIYGYSEQFPKPPIIHSDRALVFLNAGIQIFNRDETMNRYIERCWRIIHRTASKQDLEITIVHACLGHFMKNVKKHASKHMNKKQVPFGMWLMALLVNSNTLNEMIIVWRNICTLLLSVNQNDHFKISLSVLSKMADQMNANPDTTNFVLQNVTLTPKAQLISNLDTEIEQDDGVDLMLGEEEAVLNLDSSFKELFGKIFQQCKELLKTYDVEQWKHLPSNPLFSAAFLTRVLKLYMPTAPLWSNLLLGDFGRRYGYSSTSTRPSCPCHSGRTTGASESRMRVLKEAVLNKRVYSRVDEVVAKLGDTIEAVEIQFADYSLIKAGKNRLLPATKQKSASEGWNKRRRSGSTDSSYSAGRPSTNLVAMMNTRLLGQNDDANLDVGNVTHFLRFENEESNCWYNSMLQMILASGNITQAIERIGYIEGDFVSTKVLSMVNMLNTLVNKQARQGNDDERRVVKQNMISEHLLHLRWAGINIRPGLFNCVFDFFEAAIIDVLEFYDIDFNFVLDIFIECSSCKKVSSIDRHTWSYLLVTEPIVEERLEDVMANVFGETLGKKTCPQCLKDDLHTTSMSMLNCPKNLFIRFHASTTTEHDNHVMESHVDFTKLVSKNVIFTRSYARYTLQSFITFTGKDGTGHYVIYVRRKDDWYRLNDTNITLIKSSSLFGDRADRQPVVFAHFTRPSNIDIFSKALWNVFTNFSPCNIQLLPTISLNDAIAYYSKQDILNKNLLNFAVAKRFYCPNCRKGNVESVE
ncbi:unnamed protein product [Adineta ricciae]|uniref:USP domain-containing protein n=1 Tax=Adineta ricciae TaxID=249248 RepID=A0A815M7B9_ADIRI|nr:unnamed protein product [Adineta ricciae]